ncbi:hypothetical protein IWW55_004953 [Coemansia sp. RSA 2706]|nr:hypothetical protein LPJ63_000064 [Coemansia sp. RSA 2711]KAJ2296934.1 hypothetical protein IWW55_004953 [Coemansia sp. RSA 2706]KAJ2323140.1 hypothetical protein IWW51_003902 [Coemansia sp. RSA 2702]
MRIAVVGGMGAVAREVAVQAMEAGHSVGWLLGPDDKLADPSLETDFPQVLTIVRGAWDDMDKYDELLRGSDAVVVALDLHHTPAERFRPTQHLVQRAMHRTHVERIILVSAHGSGDSARRLDWELWARLNINQLFYSLLGTRALCWSVVAQYSEQERVLLRDQLRHTVLRPAAVVDGPRMGTYLASPSHVYGGYISAADVADCAIKALENDMDVDQAFSIAYSSRVA